MSPLRGFVFNAALTHSWRCGLPVFRWLRQLLLEFAAYLLEDEYEEFRAKYDAEYRELDAACEELTSSEEFVGRFEEV